MTGAVEPAEAAWIRLVWMESVRDAFPTAMSERVATMAVLEVAAPAPLDLSARMASA